jgi:hypothetical protein
MSNIPRDIYDRVADLACEITNATLAEDDALASSLYETLRCYHEELNRSGRSHPFVTETLADFTENSKEAVSLYELALQQSAAFPGEPLHTKRVDLGKKLLEFGRFEQAEAYLLDGRAGAVKNNDADYSAEADKFLGELGEKKRRGDF